MPRIKIPAPSITDTTDDTQGNKFRGSVTDGVDDTEGNAIRVRGVDDGVEDDTDGNRFYSSDAEIKHDVTPLGDANEPDDAEGNAYRPGRSVPPSANPGKGIRPKI